MALTAELPEGVRYLAELLRSRLRYGKLDPFFRPVRDQQGEYRNDGTHSFSPDELIHMDWLCENVVGHIPTLEEVIPASQATVRLLGVFQEDVP